MVTTALFTIAKTRKEPKCPLTDEWMKKMGYILIYIYIYIYTHTHMYRHELGQTPGDGEGQGGLVFCSPWGCKESDTTEQLNNNSSNRISTNYFV